MKYRKALLNRDVRAAAKGAAAEGMIPMQKREETKGENNHTGKLKGEKQ